MRLMPKYYISFHIFYWLKIEGHLTHLSCVSKHMLIWRHMSECLKYIYIYINIEYTCNNLLQKDQIMRKNRPYNPKIGKFVFQTMRDGQTDKNNDQQIEKQMNRQAVYLHENIACATLPKLYGVFPKSGLCCVMIWQNSDSCLSRVFPLDSWECSLDGWGFAVWRPECHSYN